MSAMIESHIAGLKLFKRGKVRDIYNLGTELLIVATDRISCFDVVLPTPIPGKGEILTRLSHFWFDQTSHIIQHHLSATPLSEVLKGQEAAMVQKKAMLVHKAQPLPVEAVVRGYLSGSGWKEYREQDTVCGIPLPGGLQESGKLPEPIFTPATKAEQGLHDENISFDRVVDLIGPELAQRVRDTSLRLYSFAAQFAAERGIIVADTKFEFGLWEGELLLIDEALTPDSSRFWPADQYEPGRPQLSFDKQYLRDYLVGIGWNKKPPAPELPSEIVEKTAEKYREALQRLTH